MNEQVLKQILDKLSSIENRLNIIERENKDHKYPNNNPDPSYWQPNSIYDSLAKGGCLFDNVKPGKPMGMSCSCPKCSPYSMSTTKSAVFDGKNGNGYQPLVDAYCEKYPYPPKYPPQGR